MIFKLKDGPDIIHRDGKIYTSWNDQPTNYSDRVVEYEGKSMTLAEYWHKAGRPKPTVFKPLNFNWSDEMASSW